MGLALTLSNALTGLNVNQQALTVLSQNISNANTPGYSRQVISQQALSLDGQGEGVDIGTVTRTVDQYLTSAVQAQNSTVGAAGVINDYNTRIQLLMGQPGSQNSVDSYVNNFFNAVQSLAQTPQDSTLQQGVVNNGVTLAAQLQQTASGLQGLQFQADQDITTAITTVNSDLQNIHELNATIAQNTAIGQSVADLQDQRDSFLQDVAKYINITTYTGANGAVNISTSNGVSLLDNNTYALNYSPATSAATFGNGSSLAALTVSRLDNSGNPTGAPVTLVPGGVPSGIVSPLTGGSIAGLITIRDQQIPDLNSQLDAIASSLRDQVNAITNTGTGYPGANSYTGTRLVNANDASQWSGSVRIGVLDQNGQPIASPYQDEPNGVPPLNLDLSTLNGGNPSTQDIVNAINQYYGVPQNKAELGNLNNVQMVSATSTLPGVPPTYNFGFNLSNQSATPSSFYITGAQVTDNTGAPVGGASTLNVPTIALSSANTYVTTNGSANVIINTQGANGLTNGETVYLSTPTSPPSIGGINTSNLGGFFTVSNVTPTSFQITASQAATVSTSIGVTGQTALPPYASVPAGGSINTTAAGLISTDLSSNPVSPYYNVTATVAVHDGSGVLKTSQITYRVNNNQSNMLGLVVAAQTANEDGTIVTPSVKTPLATAKLVDANGNELPKVNGKYVTSQNGYLKITAANSTNVIAIDSLDSREQGKPNNSPPIPGTNSGFSQYFDLNNFFVSNVPTNTGDTVAGSALNMKVNPALQNNPGLMPVGQMTSNQPSVPGAPPNYTYGLTPGDNSVIQQLSSLSSLAVNFPATGGLGATSQAFSSYAGQIVGSAATTAATAKSNNTNAQTLLDGYTTQASTVSGVNLDTELANTVIYQNAYAASARVITVANTLFDTLLSAFQ